MSAVSESTVGSVTGAGWSPGIHLGACKQYILLASLMMDDYFFILLEYGIYRLTSSTKCSYSLLERWTG